MPAVLTEIGFLSNASDRRYMTSEAGKEAIARSIVEAIVEYRNTVEENSRTVVVDAVGAMQPVAAPLPPLERPPVAAAPGVTFRVQVSASRSPIDTSSRGRFGRYAGQVAERRIENYYKYFVGETDSYSEALSLQRRVRETFRDAFVVAFRGGEPVAITDEMKGN
jgi:N-acetylmuramoyl-L-alanine amidase